MALFASGPSRRDTGFFGGGNRVNLSPVIVLALPFAAGPPLPRTLRSITTPFALPSGCCWALIGPVTSRPAHTPRADASILL